MINLVLFDLGNVILPVDGHRMARKLTKHSPLSHDQILENFLKDEIINSFEKGHTAPEDFFDQVCASCQINGLEFEDFLPLFNDIFDENSDVIALIEQMKTKVRLGMISNTNAIHSAHLIKQYQLFSHFHKVWFSNDVGLRKPDPAIYRLALSHFNTKPENAVFTDDLDINVEGARKLGIHAIAFRGYDNLKEELSKLGVVQ